MTFAPTDRAFHDADSHIMELPDFLRYHADPAIREQIPQVNYAASLVTDEEVELIVANGNRHTAEHVEAQIVLGDQLIAQSKEIQALGAFDRDDRSVALDMLGFRKQLVFATHRPATPFSPSRTHRCSCTSAGHRCSSILVGSAPAARRPATGWAAARKSAARTWPCCTRARRRSSR